MRNILLIAIAAPLAAQVTVTANVSPLPLAQVGTQYLLSNGSTHVGFSASGGVSPYTWAVTSGSLPSGLSLGTAGNINGTPNGCAGYNSGASPWFCSSWQEPMSASFTVTATDSTTPTALTGSARFTINAYWNPPLTSTLFAGLSPTGTPAQAAPWMTTLSGWISNIVSATGTNPAKPGFGLHHTLSNPYYRQSATENISLWEGLVDLFRQVGATDVSIEVDLSCVYRQSSCASAGGIALYNQIVPYIHGKGMTISFRPEFNGNTSTIWADANTILSGLNAACLTSPGNYTGGGAIPGNCITYQAGTCASSCTVTAGSGGQYAPQVSNWYTVLTTPCSSLSGLSIYQWIVVNWMAPGDSFVVVHEPTTMTGRWNGPYSAASTFPASGSGSSEGLGGYQDTCSNASTNSNPNGFTCTYDWVNNFLYGSTNNIINHVKNCMAGSSPCGSIQTAMHVYGDGGSGPAGRIVFTTWSGDAPIGVSSGTAAGGEDGGYSTSSCWAGSTSKCWAYRVAPQLPCWVEYGNDEYAFGPGNINAVKFALQYAQSHCLSGTGTSRTIREDETAAVPRWENWTAVNGGGIPSGGSGEIIGSNACRWHTTPNWAGPNLMAAWLPYLSSIGVRQVSPFEGEIVLPCSSSYPDNGDSPVTNNAYLAAQVTNLQNAHSGSSVLSVWGQQVASILSQWGMSAAAGTIPVW